MTGSDRSPRTENSDASPFWIFPLPDGDASDLEGQILLRGGAKIRLQKSPDRFTVRLTRPVENLAQWVSSRGCELDRPLPSIGQIALRVEATQLESIMGQLRRSILQAAETPTIAFVSHAYELAQAGTQSKSEGGKLGTSESSQAPSIFYLTDEIALQFQPETTIDQIIDLTRAVGLEVVQLIPGVAKAFVYRLTGRAIVNPLKLANRLMHHPDVLLAEPNVAQFPNALLAENISGNFAQSQAELEALGETFNSSSLPGLKGTSVTGGRRSIVVAVVDVKPFPLSQPVEQNQAAIQGIDLSHPGFDGMGKIVAPLVATPTAPTSEAAEPDETDPPSWGTLCALAAIGEAASFQESSRSTRITAIAPGCSLMPITIDPPIDDRTIEQIFDWAMRQGAAVICGAILNQDWLLPSLRQRIALDRAVAQGRNGKGCVVMVQEGSVWDALPDVLPVAHLPITNGQNGVDRPQAVEVGIRAGFAARVISANPNLTAAEVVQIVQAVRPQEEDSAVNESRDVLAEVASSMNLAVQLAQRYVSRSVAGIQSNPAHRQLLVFDSQSPQAIPDGDDRGVVCPITVQESGIVCDVEVRVAIDHPFMSDLKIWLISPVGDAILLQDRALGSTRQLITIYGLDTTPYLRSLLGRSVQGVWQLQVCDCAPGHLGILQEWQLRFGIQPRSI